ncbi:Transcription factor bye1 [Diatrype stigma]|uniref:Transcription factor BYE1 n=1 Tax=Diatrype stigma TaxID=117547 RepID=A0AAN9YRJ3_9PEZI
MSEPEPRRSVRATKGQHTKVFDLDGPEPTKRRQGKKGGKKSAEKETQHDEEEEEEIIRCICGATTQDDDDANEPWIACDKCGAWQHNVCVGMSVFTEDLTKDYFCERCAPEDHKTTLSAIAKGEKPWEGRRQKYEEDKKRKKGKKSSKGKRVSDTKDRASPAASTSKSKASPTPDVKKEEPPSEPSSAKGKRKSRDHSQGPQIKHRKVTETQSVPVPAAVYAKYTPPGDLPDSIPKLEPSRKQHAVALQKSLDSAIDAAEKKHLYKTPSGTTKKAITERLAIEIERAFNDAHQNNGHANAQLRKLVFNLKSNTELAANLLNRTLPPPSFVIMTGDELATKELQRENAELKARAEKQSILPAEEATRVRRTHKGDEVVETDNFTLGSEETPSALRRQGTKDGDVNEPRNSSARKSEGSTTPGTRPGSVAPLRVDTQAPQPSPKPNNFDIGKVFSSVKSPSASHRRRSSAQVPPSAGPGEDTDVDRLLQEDGNESPPYSPTEDIDPDVVWRGPLAMTNVADITTVARYVGGADLSKVRGIPWKELIPPVLTVAGRIPEEKAVPYLCGLRYNNQIDLVITSLQPADNADANTRTQFLAVIDYFRNKKRYGVVGERKLGNVRDTYLIPVSEGDGPIPEPMQNIDGHLIPQNRPEPMLLMVFVVRDERQNPVPADQPQKSELRQPTPGSATPVEGTPSAPRILPAAPTYSPATPQAYHPPSYTQTPIPPPTIPGHPPPVMPPRQTPTVTPTPAPAPPIQQQQQPTPSAQDPHVASLRAAQAEGERKARQVLGHLFPSATVTFLLPHAARMKEGEWNAVKRCLERDPRARDDLQLLSKLLTEEGNNARQRDQQNSQVAPPPPPNAGSPGVVQSTLAAAAANQPGPPQAAQPKA